MDNTAEQVELAVDTRMEFANKVEEVINQFSIENKSNTPDYILAEFMVSCLAAFEATSLRREAWFGVSLDVARGWEEKIMQAMGEASMCWSNIQGAGEFDSKEAKRIGDDLLKYLRNQG